MSQIPSVTGGSGGTSDAGAKKMNELNMDHFLKLMIAELQNQDPLNPMENSEMLQQISQMREIGATDKLTSTLDSVLLGQNMVSATTMIGKQVKALDDAGSMVTGKVDRVSVAGGVPSLHVGTSKVKLSNVSEITSG